MSRIALVLPHGPDLWRTGLLTAGLARVAAALAGAGFDIELIVSPGALPPDPPPLGVRVTQLSFTNPPIVAGPASARASECLRIGHQLWRRLSGDPPDLVLAPLVGGVLQPALMSRLVGESLARTAMVAWGEASTNERLRLGDIEPADLHSVVDDALESTTLALVDAVVGPRRTDDRAAGEYVQLRLPAAGPPAAAPGRSPVPIDELVFVGPASGRHGAPQFLAAVERMGQAGALGDRRVTFLGPWRVGDSGLGKAMLGRRARGWTFAFTQSDVTDPATLLAHLTRPGALAVFAGEAADDDILLADAARAGVALAVSVAHPLAATLDPSCLCAADLSDLEAFMEPGAAMASHDIAECDWAAACADLIERRRARTSRTAAPPSSASLCITHRDRPAALAAALRSRGEGLGNRLHTLVVDTGSGADALRRIAHLQTPAVEIIGRPPGETQARARNLAAARSEAEILVFLDDDNVFLGEGLFRLVEAFADPEVDIVVSTLALYDGTPGNGEPAAHLAFMGDAGWAGLLFNGFGDANFAIRRKRFLEIGGFADNDVAAFDWVFFANARAHGLRTGVLQRPAIAYQRDLAARETKWRKHDLEEPRRHVLVAYERGLAPAAMLAFAQSLSLPIVD